MHNLKIIFFIIIFIPNIIYSQVIEKDYIDFIKNGIELSTYVNLKNIKKMGDFLKQRGYTYYEMNEKGQLGFSNIDNPISKVLVINNNDKVGGVVFMVTMDDFDTFRTNFYKAMNRGYPGVMYTKFVDQFKDDPHLTIINDKLSIWEDNNGEKTYHYSSNFTKDILGGDENRSFFHGRNNSVVINIFGDNLVQFQSGINDEYWVDEFLKKDLNEVIWSK